MQSTYIYIYIYNIDIYMTYEKYGQVYDKNGIL